MQRMRTPAAERKHSQERLPKGCSYPNLKHRQRGPDLHFYENDRVFVGQINNLPVTRRIPPRKRRLRQNGFWIYAKSPMRSLSTCEARSALPGVYRQSVSYYLGKNWEQANLVWKDQY